MFAFRQLQVSYIICMHSIALVSAIICRYARSLCIAHVYTCSTLELQPFLVEGAILGEIFFRLVEISAVGRLKFVLFAAALPVLAYLHYSNAEKNEEIQQEESQQAEDEDKDFEQEDPENRIE